MLSVGQSVRRRMVRWLVNGELERRGRKPAGSEQNDKQTSVKTAGVQTGIPDGNLAVQVRSVTA
jgi:hypothetical protein